MATTAGKGKGLEGPMFSGKDEEYQVWITKFEAYAKVKGFYKVMARYRGTATGESNSDIS